MRIPFVILSDVLIIFLAGVLIGVVIAVLVFTVS